MPRLIDVSELQELKWENPVTDWCRGWNTAVDAVVDYAPTVDAIPIDWILNHEKMPKSGKGHDAIMDMIESWGERKEDAETN